MSLFRRTAAEIHRRSLWQVLGIYAATGWGALEFIAFIVEQVGLPTWVTPSALILFVVGLPIVLTTAFVQHGPSEQAAGDTAASGSSPADPPISVRKPTSRRPPHWLSWRRALLGGVLAFVGLGVTTGGYMGMRVLGIGPFGTLMAAGLLNENDRIVLSDFGASDGDASAANIITEALRIDMLQSTGLGLVDPTDVRNVLTRMERDSVSRLTESLAREVALRGGYKLVLAGDAGRLGSGYVLTARLVLPESGETYAAFRESAANDDELLGAVDALSKKVRTKIGESLKSINGSRPLEQVTTRSIDALVLYSTSERIALSLEPANGRNRADLLRQAIEIDSTFAMAYRKLGTTLSNSGFNQAAANDAFRAAWRHRDRLPEVERRLAEGMYNNSVTGNWRESLAAHRRALEIDPQQRSAHNNILIDYLALGQPDRAIESGEAALAIPNLYSSHFMNLGTAYIRVGRWDNALAMADTVGRRAERGAYGVRLKLGIMTNRAEYDRADSLAAEVLSWNPGGLTVLGYESRLTIAAVAATQGRLRRAAAQFDTLVTFFQRVELAPLELGVEAVRARQIAEVTGDVEAAGETLRRAIRATSAGLDQMPALDQPLLEVAMAFAAIGAATEAREWLARQDSARPPEAIRKELDYELARVRLLTKDGQVDEAIRALQRLGAEYACQRCVSVPLADAFDAASQPDSAAARYRLYIDTPHEDRIQSDQYYLPRAHLRLAELLEQRGDTVGARTHYAVFIDLWKEADPELQPVVQNAQRRLQALLGPG